jgi:sulfate adenylyltransferase subunit 1 (EFTu-like GTPase family)
MGLDLLRFTTAGSVDDGKSTLIGRLLYDSKQVLDDQLEHVAQASRRRGGEGTLDLALLTDGLRAEREQGITIDVAYRYFSSDGSASGGSGRRFIIADVPGHKQYTRNMVTGASTADLSVILLDARHGTVEQSRRHAYISALLRIPHLVVCVNKMDLVDWDKDVFDRIVAEFSDFVESLDVSDIAYIPISALRGDNVVEPSSQMPWYDGPTLLAHLETVEVAYDHPEEHDARFPVQWIIRPAADALGAPSPAVDAAVQENIHSGNGHAPKPAPTPISDYRGYAGQMASGMFSVGDEVLLVPSGQRTRIAAIDTFDGELEVAYAPLSVTLRFEDDLDVSRGELVCRPDSAPEVGRELTATVCWMSESPLRTGDRLLLKHNTRTVQAKITELHDRTDVVTLEHEPRIAELGLNDIGSISLRTSGPLAFDPYRVNRATGSFILIDEVTNGTVGAGLIDGSEPTND